MKLIFVHGINQDKEDELQLKEIWENAWRQGLQKSSLEIPSNVIINFPYYGKLLKHLMYNSRHLVNEKDVTRSGTTDSQLMEAEEMEFLVNYLTEISKKNAITPEDLMELEQIQSIERGGGNNATVQKILSFLDKKEVANSLVMRFFAKQAYYYLENSHIKLQVNEVVNSVFDKEPCVVVGHSLGSIITYLILNRNPEYTVMKYITLGSPLGTTAVRRHLGGPVRMPECIKHGWFNAYDDRDPVALNPLDENYFYVRPSIENKRDVKNPKDDPHGIVGYLNDPIIAKAIYDALHL